MADTPVTLAQAKVNVTDPVDLAVIDEFRKFGGLLLDRLPFDPAVAPVGGGASLTYSYTRLITERGASFRQVNTEYEAKAAARQRYSVDLAPLGGAFQVDRVLSRLGPAATGEVSFQMQQVIKSSVQKFADEFINGDYTATGGNTQGPFNDASPGFDGIDKAVTSTVTEKTATENWYWGSGADRRDAANDILDELDEWISTFDALPDVLLLNDKGASRLRSIARNAGYYERSRNDFGQEVETYRGIPFVNLGEKPATSNPIVGITAATSGAPAKTSIYGVRFGLDAVHGVSTPGPLVQTWLPDFTRSGAVKTGEVEMGPVAVAIKRTRAVGALRINIAPKTA